MLHSRRPLIWFSALTDEDKVLDRLRRCEVASDNDDSSHWPPLLHQFPCKSDHGLHILGKEDATVFRRPSQQETIVGACHSDILHTYDID